MSRVYENLATHVNARCRTHMDESCRNEACGTYKCGKERWGAGVKTQQNVRGEIGGWGRVPFDETYAPSLSTIYDGA